MALVCRMVSVVLAELFSYRLNVEKFFGTQGVPGIGDI